MPGRGNGAGGRRAVLGLGDPPTQGRWCLALAVLGGSHALAHVLRGRTLRAPIPPRRQGPSHGPQPFQAQSGQLCTTMAADPPRSAAAQTGGYLKPSVCTPHLTRTSAAWTCS